ncbi:MAG: hypothetical protein LBS80_04330, partial [Tannerella sp.]|nr:hypothetical protein [Tannerella sp.]
IVVSLGGVYQNEQPGFKLPFFKLYNIMIYSLFFGDALNQLYSSTVVRERNKGETEDLFNSYMNRAEKIIHENKHKKMLALLENAVKDFNKISVFEDKKFEKIGLLGEIFVKYNNYGQAHITEWLREQGFEVVVPPMIDFFMQAFVNRNINHKNGIVHLGKINQKLAPLIYGFVNKKLEKFEKITRKSRFYRKHETIFEIALHAEEIIDLSNQFGEGWMIAGEAANFARHGINKVVCVQPFGCIANHIVAKGIERRIKQFYPQMNLLFLDIDGGMAEVNLQNRLKFLIEQ